MPPYVFPNKETWQPCTHEQKLTWALSLLQQHIAGNDREHMNELSEQLQELIILGDFAIEDA